MKFIHIADTHLDSAFTNLSSVEGLGDLRRISQQKAVKRIIEYIKENSIKYFFISGDFYEHNYIKKSTIEYINNLFKEIPETKIYISPGNHDPYIKNSYYNTFKWAENVKIFTSKVEKVETEEANIYGFGFDDFYCRDSGIENINVDKSKINILVIHGALDSGKVEDKEYNPLSKKKLEEKGFDYIALGHIHKLDYNSEANQRIVYPGSTLSLGFDELGKHGMIVGNVEKNNIDLQFIPVDDIEFKLKEIDITSINSKEELIQIIDSADYEKNSLIEIVLTGRRNFEINIYELNRLISESKVIKIKDDTKINYDLDKLSNENTLKGLFTKSIKEKLEDNTISEEDREILQKALEIGFDALE